MARANDHMAHPHLEPPSLSLISNHTVHRLYQEHAVPIASLMRKWAAIKPSLIYKDTHMLKKTLGESSRLQENCEVEVRRALGLAQKCLIGLPCSYGISSGHNIQAESRRSLAGLHAGACKPASF